jgi:hypothetical protein
MPRGHGRLPVPGDRSAADNPIRIVRCEVGPRRAARCGSRRYRASRCGNGWRQVGRCSAQVRGIHPCRGQRPYPRADGRHRRASADPRPRPAGAAAYARSHRSLRLCPPRCGEARHRGRCGCCPSRRRGSACLAVRYLGFGFLEFRRCGIRCRGFRYRRAGPSPGEESGARRRQWSPGIRRPRSPGILRQQTAGRSGGYPPSRPTERCGTRHRPTACEGYAARRHQPRHHGPRHHGRRRGWRAVPAQFGRRMSGPGHSSRTHRRRPTAASSGSSRFRRQCGPSSGYRGRRYDRRRLSLGPWAYHVPQPRQPTSSICHLSIQTNEEGRSTLSGATLFKHVRRRPTLPRGPPRSTIGAEELNFRVRNGTGCFPFAITAETLLRCHRPSAREEGLSATVSREPHSGRKIK